MAKCEEGYLCDVCGQDVEAITDSDLYLRYVIGMIDPESLHTTRERHIHCNPALAQFIVADDFKPVVVAEPFGKQAARPAACEAARNPGHARLAAIERSRRPRSADPRLPAARGASRHRTTSEELVAARGLTAKWRYDFSGRPTNLIEFRYGRQPVSVAPGNIIGYTRDRSSTEHQRSSLPTAD